MNDSARAASTSPTLHLLNKAPSHPRFHSCLAAMGPDDRLLLLENAVVGLVDSNVTLPTGTAALAGDCQARGLTGLPGAVLVDMHGMVELTDRFSRIISW